MIELGSALTIRNKAGVLSVNVCEKISLQDVTRGIGSDKLPPIEKPRLEFHRRKDGVTLVTLCNRQDEVPCTMFLFVLTKDSIEAYRGEYIEDEREDNAFITFET